MIVSVGIDVAKDKHDCFIQSSEGEVLADVFTISKEPLNKLRSFCPHPSYSPLFRFVKAISVQNSHY